MNTTQPTLGAICSPKIFVTHRWPEAAEARLRELFDAEFNLDAHPLSLEELRDALRHYDAVLPTVTDSVTAEGLAAEPLRCRILGNFGVGFNHIDLDAATARGIIVTNTPGVLTDCTADLTLLLMLAAARRAGEGERMVRGGNWPGWNPTQLLGCKLTGKTLGLIGFGRIGQAVAARAHFGFGMPILFHTPHPPPAEVAARYGARPASIEEVMRTADFVSLHCPGGKGNHHLIDGRRLELMKPTAILINTARGDVVDNTALVEALKTRTIAAAGLDVYENEPRVNPGFLELENVVLLPHLGSATVETRTAMGFRVIENLTAFFRGERPPDQVGQ